MRLRAAVVSVLLIWTMPAFAEPSCRESNALVGPCFTVHGRLSIYNGSCVERIWPIGTKRMLALAAPNGECDPILPRSVQGLLDAAPPTTGAVFGDYLVCPVTRQRPGMMQHVCLVTATHLTAKGP